jgi:hypothetical protein
VRRKGEKRREQSLGLSNIGGFVDREKNTPKKSKYPNQ